MIIWTTYPAEKTETLQPICSDPHILGAACQHQISYVVTFCALQLPAGEWKSLAKISQPIFVSRSWRTRGCLTGRGSYPSSGRLLASQRVEQLLMNPAEPAVRHDQDHVTFCQSRREVLDDRVRIGQMSRTLPGRADGTHHRRDVDRRLLRVSLGVEQPREDDFVRAGKRSYVVVLEFLALRRVAARLEYRHDPSSRILLPRRIYRFANSGRMMRKVVDHRDTANLTSHLHPPLHAQEGP